MTQIPIVSIKMVREKDLSLEYCEKINSPKLVEVVARKMLEDKDREYLVVLSLDRKNKINSINVASIGSIGEAVVHPREIFKFAILSNASSIVIAHNHPSGDPAPSNADINTTQRIKEAGKILGIELLDHIIIGYESYISFKEEDLL